MKRFPSLAGIILALLALFGLLAPLEAAAAGPDCAAVLAEVRQGEDWLDRLIDPVLHSPAEVEERLRLYEQVHACLGEPGRSRSEEEERIYRLSEYFLIFAGGYLTPPGSSTLELVDLAASADPAVVRLREEAGVPPPPGYVYLRRYYAREEMPAPVQRVFENSEVAGVTMVARYIGVPEADPGTLAGRIFQARSLPRTVSHELVHAYMNAVVGPQRAADLPRWYEEGVAIYFSGSGEPHAVVTPRLTITATSPADYAQYRRNFQFLEAHLGRERLVELIGQSLLAADPSLLYRELELSDERALELAARGWQERRVRGRLAAVTAAMLLAAAGLYWLAPEFACECGYTGRRQDFAPGRCPECGRPVERPQRADRRPARLAANCEVCGRRFWLGQLNRLEQNPNPVRVWVEQAEGKPLAAAEPRRVRRICRACRADAAALEADLRRRELAALETAWQAVAAAYAAWLRAAPPCPPGLAGDFEPLPLSAALDACRLAAAAPEYLEWLPAPPAFEFALASPDVAAGRPDPATPGGLPLPPPGYERVVVRSRITGGYSSAQWGSLCRVEGDTIGFVWQDDN